MGCCASESTELPRYVPKSAAERAESTSPLTTTMVGLMDHHNLPNYQLSDKVSSATSNKVRNEVELAAKSTEFRPPPDVLVHLDDSIATGHRRLSQFLGSASRTTITPITNTATTVSPAKSTPLSLDPSPLSNGVHSRPVLAYDGSGSNSKSEYSTDWSTSPGDTTTITNADQIMNSVSLRFQATSLRHQPSEEHSRATHSRGTSSFGRSPIRSPLSSKKKSHSSRMDKMRMSLRVTTMQSKSTRLRMSEMFDWTRRWLTVDFLSICPKVLAPVDIAMIMPVITRFWNRKMSEESHRNRVLFAQSILEGFSNDEQGYYCHITKLIDSSTDAAKKHLKFLDEIVDMLGWLNTQMSKSDVPTLTATASSSLRTSSVGSSTLSKKKDTRTSYTSKRSSKVNDLREAVSIFMSTATTIKSGTDDVYQGVRVGDQSNSSATALGSSVSGAAGKLSAKIGRKKRQSSLEHGALKLRSINESDSLSADSSRTVDESEVAWLVTNGRVCALMEAHFKALGFQSMMKDEPITPATHVHYDPLGGGDHTGDTATKDDMKKESDVEYDEKYSEKTTERGQIIPSLDAMVKSDPGRLSAVMEDEPDSFIEIEIEEEKSGVVIAGVPTEEDFKMGEDLEAYSREIEKRRSMEPLRLSPASSSKVGKTPSMVDSKSLSAEKSIGGASASGDGSSGIDDAFCLDKWQWMYSYVRCFLRALEKFFGSRLTVKEQYCFDLLFTGIGSVLSGSPVMEYRIQELMEIRRLVTECTDWPVIKVYSALVSSNISALGYISRLLNLRFFPVCAKLFRFYRTLLLDLPQGNEESHKRIIHTMFVEICDRIRNPMVEEVPLETREMIEEMHSVVCGCLSDPSGAVPVIIHESKESGIMLSDTIVFESIPVHKMCLECLNSVFEPLFIDESLMLDLISSFKW